MKISMKEMIITALVFPLIIFATSASANWTLIENFEDGTFPEGTVITNSNELFDGEHRITEDPLDPANRVDRIVADQTSGLTNAGNFLYFHFPLAQPIENGSTVTFYHRFMAEGPEDINDADGPFGFFDATWGFVDVPEYDGSWGYSDFEVQLAYSPFGLELNWGIRNSAEAGPTAPWTHFIANQNPLTDLNVWYEVWLVIDHEADKTDVYVKGGAQYPEQTLVVQGAAYRNFGSNNPLKYFVMVSHNGNETTAAGYRGIDPWYMDDLYIDYSGINLSTPSSEPATGWVQDGKTGWKYKYDGLWSYSLLMGFIYEPGGNWVYTLHHGWVFINAPIATATSVYFQNYGWGTMSTDNGGWFYANNQWINILQPLP